ncbi:ATP synthase subunit gamma, mitochondrial [Trichuris trichiura]|uniref:ATP synthase subunit gamma n=1 Tax=Trichuris trichiura TaxID=36087 RepID=A0A077ZAI2_TRITR|nr:ATP synthase subunit gamma, mitochondrial [Trichuris trichiura]
MLPISSYSCRLGSAVLCYQQKCGFATLKDITIRLKSVSNIQKITQSMKMVAAAKYNRAQRDLRPARPYGEGASVFFDCLKLEETPKKQEHLMVVISSDRGLCGAVHSGLAKMVKQDISELENLNVRLVCVGDKSKMILSRSFPDKMLMSVNEIGKKPPTFQDARSIATEILNSGYNFDQGSIYFNRFKSAVSYIPTKLPLFSRSIIMETPQFSVYDSVDENTLESFHEYSLTSMIYYALKENACSEQSSRMSAMDGASKNAGEMIGTLSLIRNRTRQAVITRELIDIVIGASAL